MRSGSLGIAMAIACMSASGSCIAKGYLYEATCDGSYSKQGADDADLTKLHGRPIPCNYLVLYFSANGHISIQVGEKKSNVTPLGFEGDGIDYDLNPNFATLPIKRIYLPHISRPGTAESVAGAEGFCFIGGSINIRHLSDISCATKIEIGTEKLIYHINAEIRGLGQPIPGM